MITLYYMYDQDVNYAIQTLFLLLTSIMHIKKWMSASGATKHLIALMK